MLTKFQIVIKKKKKYGFSLFYFVLHSLIKRRESKMSNKNKNKTNTNLKN